MNLFHVSPAKAGGTILSSSVSDDGVQVLLRNSEKLTLAWDDVWHVKLDVTQAQAYEHTGVEKRKGSVHKSFSFICLINAGKRRSLGMGNRNL